MYVIKIFFLFLCWGGEVWVIGIWLSTYKGGILRLVMGYIGLGLSIVILYTLFCLLGGCTCRLGIFPHCV